MGYAGLGLRSILTLLKGIKFQRLQFIVEGWEALTVRPPLCVCVCVAWLRRFPLVTWLNVG